MRPFTHACVAALLSLGILAGVSSAQVLQRQLFVDAANPSWTDTGVDLSTGDLVLIEATGSACCCNSAGCESPDGGPDFTQNSAAVVPAAPQMSLCGAIGIPANDSGCGANPGSGTLLDDGWDVDGSGISGCDLLLPGIFGPGFVGSRFCTTVTSSGRLHLIVNDDRFNCYADNTGGFSVTVTRVPADCVSSVDVDVDSANPSWTSTGVQVNAGDLVVIESTGSSCCCNGVGCETPDGAPDYGANSSAVVPAAPQMSLCGAIGIPSTDSGCGATPGSGVLIDDGRDVDGVGVTGCDRSAPGLFGPGFVGSRFIARANGSGEIHLIVNDDRFNCYGDNGGVLAATIRVAPLATVVQVTQLTVLASNPSWTDTGVRVEPGDMIRIEATGSACCCNGAGCETPDGAPDYSLNSAAIVPAAPQMSLCGAIGIPASDVGCGANPGSGSFLDDGWDVDGSGLSGCDLGIAGAFGAGFVGSRFHYLVPASVSGVLHLVVNDDRFNCFSDNTGSFSVTITRVPACAVSTRTVVVHATNPSWTDTGAHVLAGEMVFIDATGSACCCNGVGCESPDGAVDYTVNSAAPVPVAPQMSLVGSIDITPNDAGCGGDPGDGVLLDDGWDVDGTGASGCSLGKPGIFGAGFVGSRFCGTASADGRIHLLVNDDRFNCFSDNTGGTGGFTATIRTSGAAACFTVGAGSPGLAGIPRLDCVNPPTVGTAFELALSSARASAFGLIVVGFDQSTVHFRRFAAELFVAPIGLVVPFLADGSGAATFAADLPYDESLAGISAYCQAILADAAATGGLAFSNGEGLRFGF